MWVRYTACTAHQVKNLKKNLVHGVYGSSMCNRSVAATGGNTIIQLSPVALFVFGGREWCFRGDRSRGVRTVTFVWVACPQEKQATGSP